jgi:hypothetical protein
VLPNNINQVEPGSNLIAHVLQRLRGHRTEGK